MLILDIPPYENMIYIITIATLGFINKKIIKYLSMTATCDNTAYSLFQNFIHSILTTNLI